jgi:Phosphoesterase family
MSPDPDAGAANLRKIDHVIVLMMENRSFDHVLGYLKLQGINPEVDGLEPAMGNADPAGTFHRVSLWGRGRSTRRPSTRATGPATSANSWRAA